MDIYAAGLFGVFIGVVISYFLWSDALFRVKRENRRIKDLLNKFNPNKQRNQHNDTH